MRVRLFFQRSAFVGCVVGSLLLARSSRAQDAVPATSTGATEGRAPAPSTDAAPQAGENEAVFRSFDESGVVIEKQRERIPGALYLNPGVIASFVGGRDATTGLGLEVSAMNFLRPTWQSFGFGAFVQAQLYDGKYPRVAAGVQGALANVGVEIGLAYRQGDVTSDSTLGTHGAIFLSLGYVELAFRAVPSIVSFGKSGVGYGLETGITLGVKLPMLLAGHDPMGSVLFSQTE